ncbi:hypothetical protein [Cylindrospermopsis raciborskii]|uniref:Uncharacterized protein n=1 Tax=Cylindrospermopsis raciborskii CENA302 TaxID=1170768 RepID=A0A9Q5QZK4_9CYAN|nr:hypothetical protein [Cylindrospermopsis raciborskii]OPH11311.1 hypothetical protein CENA302_00470 [Cylindrospermopsis raciborskii CENA302]
MARHCSCNTSNTEGSLPDKPICVAMESASDNNSGGSLSAKRISALARLYSPLICLTLERASGNNSGGSLSARAVSASARLYSS